MNWIVHSKREAINAAIIQAVDRASDPWGVKITRYEIKNITPPQSVTDALEKQMRAEREKRAAIAESEGQRQAKINVAEGDKQEAIKKSEGEKMKRINEAVALKKSNYAFCDHFVRCKHEGRTGRTRKRDAQ